MKKRVGTGWWLWALCWAPLILAVLLYYTPAIRWVRPKTHGILLKAPISITTLSVKTVGFPAASSSVRTWQLWYTVDNNCDKRCQSDLAQLHRLKEALGKDRLRVCLNTVEPVAALPFLTPGTIAIVDPRGWLMLYYAPGTPYKGVLTDLRRLLKYSRIG